MGYKTVLQEIGKRAVFDIMMEENSKVMKEVVVEARPKIATGGLEIPEREQSFAQQTIKMTEFEGLSFTSADEALQRTYCRVGHYRFIRKLGFRYDDAFTRCVNHYGKLTV